ncbi:MAG: hypothetical protein ACK4YP_19430 [Myxococcota bacterium]
MKVRLLAVLPLVACQTPLVCRAPDVWVTNAEGVEDGYCTVTLDACEDGTTLTVSCSNDTFDGDYACGWTAIRPPTSVATGNFTSSDICVLDEAGIAAEIDAGTPFALTVE